MPAASYIHDKIQRQLEEEFQVDILRSGNSHLPVATNDIEDEDENKERNAIEGFYCTCKLTLGL